MFSFLTKSKFNSITTTLFIITSTYYNIQIANALSMSQERISISSSSFTSYRRQSIPTPFLVSSRRSSDEHEHENLRRMSISMKQR